MRKENELGREFDDVTGGEGPAPPHLEPPVAGEHGQGIGRDKSVRREEKGAVGL